MHNSTQVTEELVEFLDGAVGWTVAVCHDRLPPMAQPSIPYLFLIRKAEGTRLARS